MNAEIGIVASQFLFWKYLFRLFGYWFFAVHAEIEAIPPYAHA
jgi:hypothetical protein